MTFLWTEIFDGLKFVVPTAISLAALWVGLKNRKEDKQKKEEERLSLQTVFVQPSGLRLRIDYAPKSWHVGLKARIRLLSSEKAVLRAGKFVHNVAMLGDGTHSLAQMSGPFIGTEGQVQLVPVSNGPILSGLFYLMPDADQYVGERRVRGAKACIEIVTDANEILLTKTVFISAVDAPEGQPPQFVAAA